MLRHDRCQAAHVDSCPRFWRSPLDLPLRDTFQHAYCTIRDLILNIWLLW
jgi:hypothetical protein